MFFKRRKLTESEFTKKFANELSKKTPEVIITVINDLEITRKGEGTDERKHFFDNCCSWHCVDCKHVSEIISRCILATAELCLPEKPLSIKKILPIIKNKRFVDSIIELGSDFESNHICEKYNEGLYIFYAEDCENSIKYLKKRGFHEIRNYFRKFEKSRH